MIDKTSRNLKTNSNDVVYTPLPVAKIMINMIDDYEGKRVLDPSRGAGIFYNNLPNNSIKDYCEITEGKDFFEYNKPVDIIIGNPPYSLWTKWIKKSIELNPQYICYIFGNFNLTPSRIKQFEEAGYGIVKLKLLKINWWFSPSYLILFEKDKKSIFETEYNEILCDICNKRCKRGRAGNGMNECTNIQVTS